MNTNNSSSVQSGQDFQVKGLIKKLNLNNQHKLMLITEALLNKQPQSKMSKSNSDNLRRKG